MTQLASQSLRRLGNSDLHISPIGFGAWAIGGVGGQFTWGPQDDRDSVAAIHRALDLGVNWIDTAAIYGMGHSEEVVGRALKSVASRPYVFTKCAMRWRENKEVYRSLTAASVAEELENSLRRLGLDVIDLYQVHWPEPEPEIEEGWEALERLRQQGKIRWIGVSNFSVEQIKRAQKVAPVTSLQPPYSLLRRGVETEILPYAQAQGIGVINYSPMVSGLLTGKMTAERAAALPANDWRRKSPQFQEPNLTRNLRLAALLTEIGGAHGVVAGVVAVAWTLHNPAVTAAIVGGRSARQVEETAAALSFRLTEEEFARIHAFLDANPA